MTWRDPTETAHLDSWRGSYDDWKTNAPDDSERPAGWVCFDCGANGQGPGPGVCPRCAEREERKSKWNR